ncbi:uncharacterized protein LOC119689625 [Teleopsis dalmanni]|uniref:uncharacterized protein LOC119689625 n=1 Tax=Teleopsis dalmanni TaxID=139649 RepID=UPI0018CF758C|nr:uncharacterized protein LOC119689625 [Teleopsis dalmanni]
MKTKKTEFNKGRQLNVKKATRCVEDPIRRKIKTAVQNPNRKTNRLTGNLDVCAEETTLNLQNRKICSTSQNKLKRLRGRPRKTMCDDSFKAAISAMMDASCFETLKMKSPLVEKIIKIKLKANLKPALTKKLITNEVNRNNKYKNNTRVVYGKVHPIKSGDIQKTVVENANKRGVAKNKIGQLKGKAINNGVKRLNGNSYTHNFNAVMSRDRTIKNRLPSMKTMLYAAIQAAKSGSKQLLSYYRIKQFFFEKYGLTKNNIDEYKGIIRDCLKEYEKTGEIIRVTGAGLVGSFTFYRQLRFPRKANAQKMKLIL